MNSKRYNIISLLFNAGIVILVAYAISTFFTMGGQGNMEVAGFRCFKFFTVLSNVLAALTALLFFLFNLRCLRTGIRDIPFIILLLKLIGTVSVTVTLLTVLLFLGPTMGYPAMFEGVNLILHAIVPIMAILSFTVFEQSAELKTKDSLYGLLPTVLYSLVYLVMVIFVKGWDDFYGFTFGGKLYLAPVSLIVMYAATLLFSHGLVSVHNFLYKHTAPAL